MPHATAERRAQSQHPEKIRIQGFVVQSAHGIYLHTTVDPRLGANEWGDVVLGEHVIEFSVPPDFNPVAAELESLKSQIDAESRRFTQRVNALRERISKLQCIDMAPAAGAAS